MEFTPTELRMLEVLSDGRQHTRKELHACLYDELSSLKTVKFHVSTLRKKLERRGETIVCVLNNGVHYRHVRLLASAYKN